MAAVENVPVLVSGPLRHRIMVSYALCAIAENETEAGDQRRAIEATRMARNLLGEVATLVSQPDTISLSATREAAEMLDELESRLVAVERVLPSD